MNLPPKWYKDGQEPRDSEVRLARTMSAFTTDAEWVRALDSINTWSTAGNHRQADLLLLGYLRAHGHCAIADAWEKARDIGKFAY